MWIGPFSPRKRRLISFAFDRNSSIVSYGPIQVSFCRGKQIHLDNKFYHTPVRSVLIGQQMNPLANVSQVDILIHKIP